MPALLEVAGLGKSWNGVDAVAELSFSLATGEMLALIGPNGAGKSTSFNMIGGQLRPDRGTVRLGGAEITGAPPQRLRRLGAGRTFQVAEFFGSMTLRENVQTARLAAGRGAGAFWRTLPRTDAVADALLERVGLRERADDAAAVLAYGDLKRLELAMALADAPRLLLMDEPTAGMAEAERTALMALVHRLSRQEGLAVLFTEHDPDIVFAIADRVLVMDRGRLVAAGAPAAIRADPLVRRIYLGGLDGAGAG